MRNPGAFNIETDLLGFDLSECEKGQKCSTEPKFDLSVFDLSVLKLVIQRTASVRKLKSFDLREVRLKRF